MDCRRNEQGKVKVEVNEVSKERRQVCWEKEVWACVSMSVSAGVKRLSRREQGERITVIVHNKSGIKKSVANTLRI